MQDMELQVRFIANTTPYIPLPSLHSPNLRSHFDDKGFFVHAEISKRNCPASHVSKIALNKSYNRS
jgi:hypothetical protein